MLWINACSYVCMAIACQSPVLLNEDVAVRHNIVLSNEERDALNQWFVNPEDPKVNFEIGATIDYHVRNPNVKKLILYITPQNWLTEAGNVRKIKTVDISSRSGTIVVELTSSILELFKQDGKIQQTLSLFLVPVVDDPVVFGDITIYYNRNGFKPERVIETSMSKAQAWEFLLDVMDLTQ